MKSATIKSKLQHIVIGILRYFLGVSMLVYGLTKIMRTQFIILPISTWTQPLEELSGINLTWAFLGYSPWFTVLLGLLEFIPAVLLLFRKTHYLGAILLFPVMLNVTLINFALDLWESTKNISLILLTCNLLILISGMRSILIPTAKKIWSHLKIRRFIVFESMINVVVVLAVVFIFGSQIRDYKSETDFLTGDWFNKENHIWTIIELDPVNKAPGFLPWEEGDQLFFGPLQSLEFEDGQNRTWKYSYELNETEKRLRINPGASSAWEATYAEKENSLLVLYKQAPDSTNTRKIVLKKRKIKRMDKLDFR